MQPQCVLMSEGEETNNQNQFKYLTSLPFPQWKKKRVQCKPVGWHSLTMIKPQKR